MSTETIIRKRVESFIADYAAWNGQFQSDDLTRPLDWEAVSRAFELVVSKHLLPSAKDGVGGSIGLPPEHSPETEIITLVEVRAESATVQTNNSGGVGNFYEYHLEKSGSEWRIARIRTFFHEIDEEADDPDLEDLRSSLPTFVAATELAPGLEQLFERPAKLNTPHGQATTGIQVVGTIEAPSGFLACGDPGIWANGIDVFEIAVPPGRHEIELVTDDLLQIVAAARVVFDRQSSHKKFVRATRREAISSGAREGSHIIGVDGGMIGLADAAAMIALSSRERERLYWQIVDSHLPRNDRGALFIPIGGSIEAVTIASGCGDGGYPAFWSLGEEGQPLALLFDFCDLGQPVWSHFQVPIQLNGEGKAFGQDCDCKIQITPEGEWSVISIRGKRSTKLKLYSSGNEMVFDSESAGCSVCQDETEYRLPKLRGDFAGHLDVKVYLGHRYDYVSRHHLG